MHNVVLLPVIATCTSCVLLVGNSVGYAQAQQTPQQPSAQLPSLSPALYYLFTQLLHSTKLVFSSVNSQFSLFSTSPITITTI
jgi:hypothetical protein